MGGLKLSVKHRDSALSQWEEWRKRSSHSSFPSLLHLHLLEGSLLSFWSNLWLLGVCTDMALREKKDLAVHLPIHLGSEEMSAFLVYLEIWAMGTQN